MSKQKLVFRVGMGLAATGLALSVGTGCPKEQGPTVNPVPTTNNAQPEVEKPMEKAPPDINVNTIAPLEPSADAGTDAAGPTEVSPEMLEPIKVNTPAPKNP